MITEIILLAVGFGFLNYSLPFKTLADIIHKNSIYSINSKNIFLTFDDGVNVNATPKVLDLLKKHKQKATFFLIPGYIKSYDQEIVKRIHKEGHTIGLHGRSHFLSIQPKKHLQDYIDTFNKDISTILEKEFQVKYFRPPSGWRSPQLYNMLKKNDMHLVMWSSFCWVDAYIHNSEEIFSRFKKHAKAGKIFVFHDGNADLSNDPREMLISALPKILKYMDDNNLKSKSLP